MRKNTEIWHRKSWENPEQHFSKLIIHFRTKEEISMYGVKRNKTLIVQTEFTSIQGITSYKKIHIRLISS